MMAGALKQHIPENICRAVREKPTPHNPSGYYTMSVSAIDRIPTIIALPIDRYLVEHQYPGLVLHGWEIRASHKLVPEEPCMIAY